MPPTHDNASPRPDELPDELKQRISFMMVSVRQHPHHHLLPQHRLDLYRHIGAMTDDSHQANTMIGWSAYLAAQRCLHLWDRVISLKLDAYGMPDVVGPENPLRMHYDILALCEGVLKGVMDEDAVRTDISSLWYVVGNEAEEVDYMLEIHHIPEDEANGYWQAYYALVAALHAAHHALGIHFLTDTRVSQAATDTTMQLHKLDAPALAMHAESGDDPVKRFAFWDWWLNTAILQAWFHVTDR